MKFVKSPRGHPKNPSQAPRCPRAYGWRSLPYIYHVIGKANFDIFIWQQVGSLQTRH
jgi:hypothetical protein